MLILSVKERWGKLILKNQNWNATLCILHKPGSGMGTEH